MTHRLRPRLPDLLAATALTLLTLYATHAAWRGSYTWTADGYFYEAQVLEVKGASAERARAEIFGGALTAERRELEHGNAVQRIGDPDWVEYSSDFYRRRWLVPLAAAAIDPLLGLRSLVTVSLVGLLGTVLGLFALTRLTFGVVASALAAALVGLSPTVRGAAIHPLTDAPGLALETLALVGLVLSLTRNLRWLALWLVALLALSLTRDNGAVLVLTAAFYAVAVGSRTAAVATVAGAAALAPAYLLVPVDASKLLAFTLNGFLIPPSTGLDFIADRYPGAAFDAFVRNFTMFDDFEAIGGLVLVVGVAALIVARRDQLVDVVRASVPACALYLLTLPQLGFRLWIVLAPASAVGYAALVDRLAGAAMLRWRTRRARRALGVTEFGAFVIVSVPAHRLRRGR